MKKLLFLLLFVPILAQGQTFTGHSKVNLQRGIGVTEKAELDFGDIVASGDGTITIAPDGQTAISANLQQKGLTSSGVFKIEGMPSMNFVLSLPSTATLLCNGVSLYLTEFKSNLTNGVGKLDANGVYNLSIGSKLSVPMNFVYGFYQGSYTIVVNYQ